MFSFFEDADIFASEDCVTIESEIGECNSPPEPEVEEEFVIDLIEIVITICSMTLFNSTR